MLSNLIVTQQRTIVVIDDLGRERFSHDFLCQLLREQGQDDATIKILPFNAELKHQTTFDKFLKECTKKTADVAAAAAAETATTTTTTTTDGQWNILLPPLSDLLSYQRPAVIFQFLYKLRKCSKQIKRTFLWISTQHVLQSDAAYIIAACEYISDLVLHLKSEKELTILTRKSGGGVTNKNYTYHLKSNQFMVESVAAAAAASAMKQKQLNESAEGATNRKTQSLGGTFKIELEEDELIARNALKLPYERTSEAEECGNIIYTPDAADDFDEEDPDDDLCI